MRPAPCPAERPPAPDNQVSLLLSFRCVCIEGECSIYFFCRLEGKKGTMASQQEEKSPFKKKKQQEHGRLCGRVSVGLSRQGDHLGIRPQGASHACSGRSGPKTVGAAVGLDTPCRRGKARARGPALAQSTEGQHGDPGTTETLVPLPAWTQAATNAPPATPTGRPGMGWRPLA